MCLLNKFHGMKTVEALQRKLVEAPVPAYSSFTKDFVLETDASIEGLGAVLSQMDISTQLLLLAEQFHCPSTIIASPSWKCWWLSCTSIITSIISV